MKLNIDCVRDVLLEFETFPIGCYFVESFKKSIEHYDQETVLYVLVKLTEADYINCGLCMKVTLKTILPLSGQAFILPKRSSVPLSFCRCYGTHP